MASWKVPRQGLECFVEERRLQARGSTKGNHGSGLAGQGKKSLWPLNTRPAEEQAREQTGQQMCLEDRRGLS